jgi:AraC-like DNA-binding protein
MSRGRRRELVTDWSQRVDDPSLQSELRTVLTAALDELPAEYRAVVELRDVEGLSQRDIGEVLGITVASVKTRVHRARLFLRKRLAGYLAPGSGVPARVVGGPRPARAGRRGGEMMSEHASNADAIGSRALMPALCGLADQVTGGLPWSRLRRVVEYVQTNLAGELRLAELSAQVHMSPYHFARLFKKSTDASPRQFVIGRRIEAAKLLLAEQQPPIGKVALAVGFGSQSHFCTIFRRITGVTPGQYRVAVHMVTCSAQSLAARSRRYRRGWTVGLARGPAGAMAGSAPTETSTRFGIRPGWPLVRQRAVRRIGILPKGSPLPPVRRTRTSEGLDHKKRERSWAWSSA